MKTDKKEAEKLTELLSQAEDHPIMQKIKAEKAAAILATRTEAVGKIETLNKERNRIIPKLQTILAEKEETFKKAKETMDAATDEFLMSKANLYSESNRISHEIGKQEKILYETADPLLDEAIVFFNDKLCYFRSPGRISHDARGGERNIFTDTKTLKVESNREAVLSALAYCQVAIKELELMKLKPELDTEKIERMKAGIPSIDIYTEYQGEKPLERAPHPLAGLPSDSELDWRRDKLIEKAKKLIRK